MATAVTFWQLPEEESKFLRYLASTGDIVACIDEIVDDRARLEPQSIQQLIEQRDPEDVLFGPREFMEQAAVHCYDRVDDTFQRRGRVPSAGFTTETDGQTFHSRFYMDAPLIKYSRGRWRAPGQLGQSNLCAAWWHVEEDPDDPAIVRRVDKPDAFIKWARRVFAWMRRATPRWHQYRGYRVTERVAQAIADGLEIVP